ncbi:conserved hypothetical protein [Anaeromyxobacter dehalogenans 2CP-C]|uniref:Uncharacterized protein n=2 Tax=Anaeromyxobacter dehalogenans TaxID=161493 RepID=Q2IJJ4_ANADE|nr:conserved hypothetical protein [Anaeromyxobacter dehalogenans 2CP-C]
MSPATRRGENARRGGARGRAREVQYRGSPSQPQPRSRTMFERAAFLAIPAALAMLAGACSSRSDAAVPPPPPAAHADALPDPAAVPAPAPVPEQAGFHPAEPEPQPSADEIAAFQAPVPK